MTSLVGYAYGRGSGHPRLLGGGTSKAAILALVAQNFFGVEVVKAPELVGRSTPSPREGNGVTGQSAAA